MANNYQEWEDLGRNVQEIIDRAVNSHDYQKLNQTIRQVVDKAVDMGSEAVRKVKENSARSDNQSGQQRSTGVKQGEVVRNPKSNLPALYGSTGGKTAGGIVQIAGGGLLSCGTFVSLLSTAAVDMMFGTAGLMSFGGGLTIAGFGVGVLLVCSGLNTLGKVNRFKTYRKALGQKTYCTLEKLARSVGKNVKFVRKEVRQMIDQGLFIEGHLDHEQTQLITSDETYRHYEQSRRQMEQRRQQEAADKAKKAASAQDARVQEVLDKGNAFIAEIRRCNDAIPGVEISVKIDRMETIVRRIFERAESHPEIVPDLKKMMDYYLPMTVKLLNAYADMDAQPIQGQTILNSKREIEATLDTLNLAFEKLLDSVFADTAMDISSDISVLQTLLAQEGLAEDELTKMKKKNNL